MIETITPRQAAEILRSNGMSITAETLGAGLQQGVYPFGVCVKLERSPVYQIFKPLLEKWIDERSTKV